MFAFLLSVLATFAAIWLGRPLAAVLGAWTQEPVHWRRLTPRQSFVLALRGVLVVALVATILGHVWEWEFFASSRNFRVLMGFVFGCLLWLFLRQVGAPNRALRTDAREGRETADGGLREDGDGRGWSVTRAPKQLTLLAAALVAVWLWALLAPHGELHDVIRTVKTPIIEAHFAHNETDLRMELQLEPEARGFLVLGPGGLADTLYTARHEVLVQRARAAMGEGDGPSANERAVNAFDLVKVLQPVARCIDALNQRYHDRTATTALLHEVAAGWAGAIILARELADAEAGGAALAPIEMRLEQAIERFETAIEDHLWVADQLRQADLSGRPPAEAICRTDFVARLEGVQGAAEVILHPAVVLATATFQFWAGDPEAAHWLIRQAADGEHEDVYPRLLYLRGFAQRWRERPDRLKPDSYLADWARDIEIHEARAKAVRRLIGNRPCARPGHELAELAYDEFLELPADAIDACELRYAAAYYAFRAQKERMALVYESARHLLTGREFPDRDDVLRRALKHGEALRDFVEKDALRADDAYMLQVLDIDGRRLRPAITSSSAAQNYAFALDAYGAVRLAQAFYDGDAGEAETEPAIVAFNAALGYGAEAGAGWTFKREVHERLAQAQRAIGLEGP